MGYKHRNGCNPDFMSKQDTGSIKQQGSPIKTDTTKIKDDIFIDRVDRRLGGKEPGNYKTLNAKLDSARKGLIPATSGKENPQVKRIKKRLSE